MPTLTSLISRVNAYSAKGDHDVPAFYTGWGHAYTRSVAIWYMKRWFPANEPKYDCYWYGAAVDQMWFSTQYEWIDAYPDEFAYILE